MQRGPNGRLMVNSNPAGPDAELLKQWRQLAEADWCRPNHRSWVAVQEQLEMVNGSTSLLIGGGSSMSMAAGTPSMSMADGMDEVRARHGLEGRGWRGCSRMKPWRRRCLTWVWVTGRRRQHAYDIVCLSHPHDRGC